MARDLSLLSKGYGVRLNAMPSEGSVENLISILTEEEVHLAIIQDDVMAFMKMKSSQKPEDRLHRAIVEKTRLIFPLSNEEIHVFGKESIRSFDQLQGKRVAVGYPGIGTRLTSYLMFNVSGIEPAREIEIGDQNALEALSRGQVDAMIQVAGYPVKLFEDFNNTGGFHLIPLTNQKIRQLYSPSVIPRRTYPWQDAPINTILVKAVLVTGDYGGKICELVGILAKIIADDIGWLKKYGHPKWKTVDLDAKMSSWKRSTCIKNLQ